MELSEDEMAELRERDVILVDTEPGSTLMVLSDGRRYQVTLELRDGSYFATVGLRLDASSPRSQAAINLVNQLVDPREAPA